MDFLYRTATLIHSSNHSTAKLTLNMRRNFRQPKHCRVCVRSPPSWIWIRDDKLTLVKSSCAKIFGELLSHTDIRKTFGPLPDWRTGNHLYNPSFTGPPKPLQGLIFFNIKIPGRGASYRRTSTIRVFIGLPLFAPVGDQGPVDFPISVAVNYPYRRYKSIWKFRSIIDMDFSISIYQVSNLTSPIMG